MNQPTQPTIPYGLWPSSISPQRIARRVRLDDVQWSADGQGLLWLEGRADSAVLLYQGGNEARVELTEAHSPRGAVGYGGGAFTAGVVPGKDQQPTSGAVFANADGRLYRLGLVYDRPTPITPAFEAVASPKISPDGQWTVFVYSDGRTDLLGLVPTDGSAWPKQIARGADFYMQPTWHPSGTSLAWVEWDHPNMPWDETRVVLAQVDAARPGDLPGLTGHKVISGGSGIQASQPVFSPDGRWLSLVEEAGEWPDLVLYDLERGERKVLVEGSGFELSLPAWVQGIHAYGWSHDSSAIYFLRYQGPYTSLWKVNLADGAVQPIDTAPYTWLTQLAVSPTRHAVACIASAPNLPDRIIEWDSQRQPALRVAARSGVEDMDPGSLSIPREIQWAGPGGSPVYALYYPPANPGCTGSGLPPAVIQVHGGPTSITGSRFNSEAVYFTSRGYAWVELNYRGSTGYGRSYRNALRQAWGQADVEDAAGCARALAEQALADPARLVIKGGSAGGYTVLNALIHHPGLFRAGVCLYGVTNLFMLDLDTHKFEQHYNATLVGSLPEAAPQYRAWSPVFHASQVKDPLFIFQGDLDKVVPPSQAEALITALKQNGIPYQYRLYAGEGHGFRKTETIIDYLQETEKFLQQHVLFG